MILDIGSGVALGIVTLLTAYLGVHVTMHQVESDEKKRPFKLGFVCCGFLGVALIAWQAARNGQTQSALRRVLDQIEYNTANSPKVLTSTATVNFGSIVDGGYSADQTFLLKGATTRDSIRAGWPSTFPSDVSGDMFVPKDDTASVRLSNLRGHTVTYNSVVVRGTILR